MRITQARRIISLLRPPTFQNTGSTARDHLASERTFLSWLRTGLGFVALGVGVERFSRLELATPVPVQLGGEGDGKESAEDRRLSLQQQKESDLAAEETLVISLLGTGGACISYGVVRYFSTLKLLQQGVYKPAFLGAGLLGCVVAGFAGAGAGSVWASEYKARQEDKSLQAGLEAGVKKLLGHDIGHHDEVDTKSKEHNNHGKDSTQ